jgi:hypothetical protein
MGQGDAYLVSSFHRSFRVKALVCASSSSAETTPAFSATWLEVSSCASSGLSS